MVYRVTTLYSSADKMLTVFVFVSDLWTAAGREPLTAHSSGVAETDDSRISDREVTQLHRHEPRLPGALTIDPWFVE